MFSFSAFAGERTVTLSCGSPIAQNNGNYYEGGAANVKVILNTDRSVQVAVEGYAIVPNPTISSVPASAKGQFGNYFETSNGDKIYLFRGSNCIKSTITAILMGGTSTVSNCTYVENDQMVGSDFDFCTKQ